MAHESFEDGTVAAVLNEHFVSIKVDREERPDVDSIYMRACQALTGSGGWPLSLFLTPEQEPFYAGTYFPKTARYGATGFIDLLHAVREAWHTNRVALLRSASQIRDFLQKSTEAASPALQDGEDPVQQAFDILSATFDAEHGGFGPAPKFPMPHTLLLLMRHSSITGETQYLDMAEKTLTQMAHGGIFDHIGFGFSRYSTDEQWLAPHFEKMLYDNALLLMAYARAYGLTGKRLYRDTALQVTRYVRRELTHPGGGFYSAQDADSEGVEGKYYLLQPEELVSVLGAKSAKAVCSCLDITPEGNFEGASIPNLLKSGALSPEAERLLPDIYEYRKKRYPLHLDDKALTAWNGLMIAALAYAETILPGEGLLPMAHNAAAFVESHLAEGDTLHTSYRDGKRNGTGYLDDYACYILGLLALHQATLDLCYLNRAEALAEVAIRRFFDGTSGGFYLYANESEQLILRPKETYDGAIPSGNAIMTYVLVLLVLLKGQACFESVLTRQFAFMRGQAIHPTGHNFYLLALLLQQRPPRKIICALPKGGAAPNDLRARYPDALLLALEADEIYASLEEMPTYYVCDEVGCRKPTTLPPV